MIYKIISKYIFKSVLVCILLFSAKLNASDSYFNISLSTLEDRLLINTDTDYNIYGYQFQITNVSLSDCIDPSGSEFYVNVSDNGNILGVSLSGSTIPSGQNTILSCLIINNQATDSEGSCLVPSSVIIANGQSVGGYTPQVPDSEIVIGDCLYLDCDSELNGDNSNCLDCAGIPNGTSEIDCLGICGDPNGENFAVTDLCGNCAGSCNSAPIIDCDCEAVYFNGINTIACNGNCNPDTYTDPCFIWNADTWIDNPGGQDFLYEPGEELNDINGNGLADIGCYDCGGNYISDENFDMGNVFREYSCAIPNLIFNTQFYCSDAINNNIFDDGSCLSNYDKGLITEFSLFSAYPNPFNPITTINYSVEKAGNVKIDIYNSLGQHVYTLVDSYHIPGGIYKTSWNSNNQFNVPVSSGVYFIKAQHANNILLQQLTLIK